MIARPFGGTDLHASVLGLGGNTFGPPRLDAEQSTRVIRAALERGVTFVDTAAVYGHGRSESFLGEAARPPGRDADRDEVQFHRPRL